jgi:alpha-L-fucosidase
MEFFVRSSGGWQTGVQNEQEEGANANISSIRLFTVKRNFSLNPIETCEGEWKECNSESVASFSAAAYFFGRELQKKLKIPIGLISTCWGGSPIEAWTRKEVVNSDIDFNKLYSKVTAEQNKPSMLYNAMIHPLLNYVIKGAIWYQGESNRNEPDIYKKLFPAMIKNWREDFKVGEFPFYYVQIAPFNYKELHSGALLREAQMQCMATSNTGMAVTLDIGDIYDIHPKNKQDVGKRLSLWALAKTYNVKNIVYSGPIYKSMNIENNKIRLLFDYSGSGLVCKGNELTEFEISGADKKFVPAKAVIDGNTVLVSADEITEPTAIRFAFTNISQPNLFNREGLPASSFRTDNWPIVNKIVSLTIKVDDATNQIFAILKSNDSTASIRYTFDGGEPTSNSPLFSKNLKLDNSVQIRARAFVNNTASLVINKFDFIKCSSTGKKISLKNNFNPRYSGGGVFGLVNGLKGTEDLNDGNWQGYEENDFEAAIDLESIIDINNISVRFLQEINSLIFMPPFVEFSTSEDGTNFKTISRIKNDIPENKKSVQIKEFASGFSNMKARYIKITAKNIGTCPKGHPGAGKKAWLFLDEILVNEVTETQGEHDNRMKWWRDSKFGMFIHWGIYSVPAGIYNGKESCGEWIMDCSKIPISEYEKYTTQFNPVKFNAEEWVKIAKNAGMKYIVITSKHHDGFSMFKSKISKYNIVDSTPFKRDVLKELAEACKKENITFCFYHSIMDWHHADAKGDNFSKYRENYLKPQLKELLTNYGPLGVLWFDGEWIGEWTETQGKDLYNYVRSFQPNIIINNRVGKGRMGMAGMSKDPNYIGDFGTPEQEIPNEGLPEVDWESCMTMNDTWGYKSNDHNWKSTGNLINDLVDIVAKGGNFLLNVGPTSEGLIPFPSIERLKEIGDWLKINGEAIYNTKMYRIAKEGDAVRYCSSKDGKYVYAILLEKPPDKLILKYVSSKPNSSIRLLGSDELLKWKKEE